MRRSVALVGLLVVIAIAVGATALVVAESPHPVEDVSLGDKRATVDLAEDAEINTLTVIKPNGDALWKIERVENRDAVTFPLYNHPNAVVEAEDDGPKEIGFTPPMRVAKSLFAANRQPLPPGEYEVVAVNDGEIVQNMTFSYGSV